MLGNLEDFSLLGLLREKQNVYLGSIFLDPEDIKCLNLKAVWNFGK